MRPVTRQVFAALRAEQQKLVSQRLGFGTDLQTWVDELLSTACAGALSAEAPRKDCREAASRPSYFWVELQSGGGGAVNAMTKTKNEEA